MAKAQTTTPAETKSTVLKTDAVLNATKQVKTTDFSATIQFGADPKDRVTVYASQIKDIAENGLRYKLPEGKKVKIGSLEEMLKSITQSDFDYGTLDGVPELQRIIKGLMKAETNITKFEIFLGPKPAGPDSASPPMEYEIEVSSTTMNPEKPTEALPLQLFEGFNVVELGFSTKSKNVEVKAAKPANKALKAGAVADDAEDAEIIES